MSLWRLLLVGTHSICLTVFWLERCTKKGMNGNSIGLKSGRKVISKKKNWSYLISIANFMDLGFRFYTFKKYVFGDVHVLVLRWLRDLLVSRKNRVSS